jgi:hypothetical protein
VKRLIELLFVIECHESDMIWHLQHGTVAEFEESKRLRAKSLRMLAKVVRFAVPTFD